MRSALIALAIASSLIASSTVSADPSPGNSTTPQCVTLVGTDAAGQPDPRGFFTVVLRDLANNPIAGAPVWFDVADDPDVLIALDQRQPDAQAICAPGAHTVVQKLTDGLGRATFAVLGAARAGAGTAVGGKGRFYALLGGPPTLLSNVRVSAFDLDASNGVSANDLSLWLGDFASGVALDRSDYDCNGSVGANDLSVWLAAFGAAGSVLSAHPLVPGSACP